MSSATGAVAALVFALVVTGYLVQSRLPPPKPRIIGIDLGTTFSCVATYESKSGAVQIYKDSSNHSIIPSVVAVLEDGSVLVGQSAVNQIELNPTRTIFDAKRFIGRRFDEAEISTAQEKYPFKILLDDDGHARFEVLSSNGSRSLTPEDIGAHILRTLKQAVERSIDRPVTAAVLSVPADFNAAQRNATVRAATLAGLKVLRVINEPTAAALAYGLHKKASTSTVLVIDFGGGTLDVSMLLIQGGMFVTMAMAGNNRLGGQDVNHNLMEFFSERVREKFGDGPRSARDMQIVRDAAEKVKIALTDDTTAMFRVELHDVVATGMRLNRPITFEYEMTRAEFEAVNAEIFRKFVKPIERVLSDAEMRAEDVDEIVLVGGSTRIPRIRAITAELFGKPPHTAIDPDVAVVTGVAVQANIAGNGWPLKVSAVEIQRDESVKKVDVSAES